MNKLNNVSFSEVHISGGFWKNRQDINKNVTAKAIYNRFHETYRFEALKCKKSDRFSPHIYWDSDVAKWIEGVCCIIRKHPDNTLKKLVDDAVNSIISSQDEDGYFNSYFLLHETDKRFTYRGHHELYCAGHLFEASVAYYEATGNKSFLDAMCRYADYIYDRFAVKKDTVFVTGEHPEIELALIRLAEAS